MKDEILKGDLGHTLSHCHKFWQLQRKSPSSQPGEFLVLEMFGQKPTFAGSPQTRETFALLKKKILIS